MTQQNTQIAGFPDVWGGRSKAVPVDHQGPSSYTTGGETFPSQGVYGGPNSLGVSGVLWASEGTSESGNYQVVPVFGGSGKVRGTILLKWLYNGFDPSQTSPGIALSLGPLSAAATQSTYTVGGLLTVVGANTLSAGQFIVFSNGASAAGIFLDGVMGYVASATATGYTVNFGQGSALNYTIATDTLKYQVVEVNSGNLLQAQALAAPITGVLATANLLTITQVNSLVAGQFVYLNGPFKAASVYALGAIVQVASATASSWTANWQGTIISQTSGETAVASLLVTNGGAPVTTVPGAFATITNSLAVAAGASAAGLLTLTANQNYAAGNIIVVQGLATNTPVNGTIATVIASGLTPAIIKANGWGVVASTHSEASGTAAVLATGAPTSLAPAAEVAAGTNLSAEVIRVLVIGG